MAGASKLALLLATPFSILHRPSLFRLHRHLRSISLRPLSTAPNRLSSQSLLPISASSQEFHTQSSYGNTVRDADYYSGQPFTPLPPATANFSSHPWSEWSKLVDTLYAAGYLDERVANPDDSFADYSGLPEEFVRAAAACLAFARDRPDILGLLSRRDMETLAENGTPFLFQNAADTERRMRSFLFSTGPSYVVESDIARTVDLMKYIVSYASSVLPSGGNNIRYPEPAEAAVRYLLSELADMSCRTRDSDIHGPEPYQDSGRHRQTPRFLGPKIEMKRGDWICPKCSFMNFARNLKCLECEEPRPKRQLTGMEWECPQCDFHNYGRNLACLRCDCKRPGEAMFSKASSTQALGYNSENYTSNAAVDSRLAANDEKAQRWFGKVSQPNPPDSNNFSADEDFPEIMPLRKGVNRFVVSTRKTPLDRRITNSQNQSNLGDYDSPEGGKGTTDGSSTHSRLGSPFESPRGSNSNYVPFVPLPADMFAKRTQPSTNNNDKEVVMKNSDSISSNLHNEAHNLDIHKESVTTEDNFQLSEKPSIKAGMQIDEKEQEDKTERWFKRVAELHDASDLASAISDEDFPEIMPMRKGENRFVISKKDRSLTSPAYKRQESIEQGSNTNFVPFVPFPPDYFAKKDKQQLRSVDSKVESAGAGDTFPNRPSDEKIDNDMPAMNNVNNVPRRGTPQTSTRAQFSDDNRGPLNPNQYSSFIGSQSIVSNSWNTSAQNTASQASNSGETPRQPPENQNVSSGWTGKSLEGSAVKEPDPLDMSEEAKAERWFRRVAQIKDISELSQIPDEDFPSIMPMRKGVNRFVVSKRKTPMERRLTSTQYRKNLPIVNSDPIKKENESS